MEALLLQLLLLSLLLGETSMVVRRFLCRSRALWFWNQ